MPLFNSIEEKKRAEDEAQARLKEKFEKDGKDDLTWRLVEVSTEIDRKLIETKECRYHLLFTEVEKTKDQDRRDILLMLLKACEWADEMRHRGYPIGYPLP